MNIVFMLCCPVLSHCHILYYYCLIFIFKELEMGIPIKKSYHFMCNVNKA
jgi:hypothetical protein